jgi:hypothetical protein
MKREGGMGKERGKWLGVCGGEGGRITKNAREAKREKIFYNVFHKKSNTIQIRVSKRGDKRSTWLNGLSELVSYAVSKLAQRGVRRGQMSSPSRDKKGRVRGRRAEA